MKRNELITKLAQETKETKQSCEKIFNALGEIVLNVLKEKGNVALGNIGHFKYKKSAARTCKMIRTQELTDIPEKGTARFALSKYAKASLSRIV